MSFNNNTYKAKGYKIGQLNRRLKLFIALSTKTALGGEAIDFQEWKETFTAIQHGGGKDVEDFAADREVGFDSKKFIIRYRPEVTETMLLEFEGKQYDIISINEYLDTPKKHYQIIRATYREKPVQLLANLQPNLIHQFTQKISKASGTEVRISNGVLHSPGELGETSLDAYCHLYRSGVRALYNIDYTIEGSNLVFVRKLRGETIFYQQFKVS